MFCLLYLGKWKPLVFVSVGSMGTSKTYVKIYKEDELFTTSEFVSALIWI